MPATHLRSRTGPELVDASVQLIREHPRALLLLGVLLVLPGLAFTLFNSLVLGQNVATLTTFTAATALVVAPAFIVASCWTFVAFGALVTSAAAAYTDGRAVEPADALRRAFSRAGTLIGSGLLTYLLVGVQLIGLMAVFGGGLLVVAGIAAYFGRSALQSAGGPIAAGIFGIVFTLVLGVIAIACGAFLLGRYFTLPATVMLEGLGATDGMRRARELAKGSMKRVTVVLLLVGLLFMSVTVGGVALAMFVLRNAVLGNVIATVFNVPLYTFFGALCAVLYYDLRIRHEGFDVELLAAELGPTAPAAAAP